MHKAKFYKVDEIRNVINSKIKKNKDLISGFETFCKIMKTIENDKRIFNCYIVEYQIELNCPYPYVVFRIGFTKGYKFLSFFVAVRKLQVLLIDETDMINNPKVGDIVNYVFTKQNVLEMFKSKAKPMLS